MSGRLNQRESEIARDVVVEIMSRLEFLAGVGLGYLTLDRAAPTLSGGEAQRIRLAPQLGSNLQGVCYVLNEPTIGLHPRDNGILLSALAKLGDKGDTLVVAEHDEDTIRRADHLIDIGPGAGRRGGTLVAQGSVAALSANADSVTGRFLATPLKHPLQASRAIDWDATALLLRGAHLHNLQQVDLRVPLNRLVAVTGVSGSGKSTLARDVLLANVQALVALKASKAGRDAVAAGRAAGGLPALVGCTGIEGFEGIDRALEVDQTQIGNTAFLPRPLHRFLGRPPQTFHRNAGSQGTWLWHGALQFQRRRRPLPGLRGPGHDDHRHELFARCESALRHLPRRPLQPRNAGCQLAREKHRRRAANGGR